MQNHSLDIVPILSRPLPPHPRLLASVQDWERLKKQIGSDSVSARIFVSLQKKALRTLAAPTCERVVTGRRMLYVSREVLERVGALAVAFKITGDPRFSWRAIEELKSACRFSDWNPAHFLDVAEMALAVAIGYDWLHDELDGETKNLVSSALLEKGLRPSMQEPLPFFITCQNNWNQVCHAGMAGAAIAIADREPEIAEFIIRRCIDNLGPAAAVYAPDGAYPEGPMYWNYGTSFHVVLADALLRLTGSTHGVDAYRGFAASADYLLQATTPKGEFYSYADCRKTRHAVIPLFWFARRFRRPDLISADLEQLHYHLDLYDQARFDDFNYRLLSLALLWRDPAVKPGENIPPARNWLGRGIMPVAVHRSAFNNSQALYLAIKGGSPSWNHAHMDGGSFFFEADGVTWATDLGMQDYETLESAGIDLWARNQDSGRWKVFRLGPESHNILRFNNLPQWIQGHAGFIRFKGDGAAPHSVLDLSSLYEGQVQSVQRGLMMINERAVLFQDEWIAAQATEASWQWITPAEVSVQGHCILLSSQGKTCSLQILDSPQVQIDTADTAVLIQPYDTPNPGVNRISVKIRTPAGQKGRLRVLAVPGSSEAVTPPAFQALDAWSEKLPECRHPTPVRRD